MEPRMLAHRKHISGEVLAVKTVHCVYTLWKQIRVKLVSIDPCDDKTVALGLAWLWPWP